MMPDPSTLVSLVFAHKWLALFSLIAWAVVRLLRDDAKVLPDLAGKWRDLIALGLSAAAGGCDAVALGKSAKEAAAGAAVVFVVAIMGQYVPIFRSLKKKPDEPSGGSGVGAAAAGAVLVCVGLLCAGEACTPKHVKDVNDVATPVVDGACRTIEAVTPNGGVKIACLIAEEITDLVHSIFGAQADGGSARNAGMPCQIIAAEGVSVCATDAELLAEFAALDRKRGARRKRDAGPQ